MIKVTVDTGGYTDQIFISRLSYVLDFIQNHPCAPADVLFVINETRNADIIINYSYVGREYLIIPQNVYFGRSDMLQITPLEIDINYKGHLLKGFANHGGSDFISFDIFETIFFHISRYEEWFFDAHKLDQHGTLASVHQYLVKNNLHDIPVVDILVTYFFEQIGLQPKLILSPIAMSHDIDVIEKYPNYYKFMRGYGNILFYQSNKAKNLLRHTSSYIKMIFQNKKDPYDTFDWLLVNSSQKINQKIIYWLTGGKTKYEGFFSIQDPKVKEIMEASIKNGYIVGLHPSYDTMGNKKMMSDELQELSSVASINIRDVRQHFLRFDIKKTGKILDELGIKSDSSLGFRDRIGFRCGTGFPYHLYDYNDECAFGFTEIPLVVMDIAAMRESRWDSRKFVQNISHFLETNKYNTQITFNFHNSFFDPVLLDASYIREWYISTFR